MGHKCNINFPWIPPLVLLVLLPTLAFAQFEGSSMMDFLFMYPIISIFAIALIVGFRKTLKHLYLRNTWLKFGLAAALISIVLGSLPQLGFLYTMFIWKIFHPIFPIKEYFAPIFHVVLFYLLIQICVFLLGAGVGLVYEKIKKKL